MSARSQSLRFILSLRLYSGFITSRLGRPPDNMGNPGNIQMVWFNVKM